MHDMMCVRLSIGFVSAQLPQPRHCPQAVGVPVVVGYGLTETSPVLTVRRLACNVRGTIGEPPPDRQGGGRHVPTTSTRQGCSLGD